MSFTGKVTSTVTLCSSPKLTPTANALIEDIGAFLLDTGKTTVFQTYLKVQFTGIQKNKTLVLTGTEYDAARVDKPNYCRIQNYDETVPTPQLVSEQFYFVDRIERGALKSIKVFLTLDTLNTFQGLIKNGLTARTLTNREHRDRFINVGVSYPLSKNFPKVVDNVSEGLTPIQFQQSRTAIETSTAGLSGYNWYLIYKAMNEMSDVTAGNPITCFLCADHSIQLQGTSSGAVETWLPADLTDGVVYYVLGSENSDAYVKAHRAGGTDDFDMTNSYEMMFAFWKYGSGIMMTDAVGSGTYPRDPNWNPAMTVYSSLEFTRCRILRVETPATSPSGDMIQIASFPSVTLNSGVLAAKTVAPFSTVDNSDSRLVKIVKLPYPPCHIGYNETTHDYSFPSGWTYQNGLMKLDDMHSDFACADFAYVTFAEAFQTITKTDWNVSRFLDDAKLLHSDFFTEKFVYDTFFVDFKMEHFSYAVGASSLSLNVSFKPSNMISSNMLFEIDPNEYGYLKQDDYHVLIASRNNEMPIFNNAFLNYMRNGYNYDKKAKATETSSRWIGAGLTAAGAVVSAVAGGPLGAVGAVSLGISAVSQFVSNISSQISSENTFQSKLADLKAQSTSASGSDDVDLFQAYGSNKLLHFQYACSSNVKAMLNDLFFYFGYSTNRQKIPSFSSRVWFNFIQCDPVFTMSTYGALGDFVPDIVDKMKAGITVFHHVQWGTPFPFNSDWDVDQVKENFESWFKQ